MGDDFGFTAALLSMHDVKDQLKRHVYGRSYAAFASGDAARDAIRSRDQLAARQAYVREAFLASVGGVPSTDTPLYPEITGVRLGNRFRIENVIFQPRPKTYVTANMYVPNERTHPGGAVLFLCGHAEEGKQYDPYRHVCERLAAAGLVVLAMDPVGQGERLSYGEDDGAAGRPARWGTSEHDYAGHLCWLTGGAIARYFLHDAMRAIDYLQARPEVDPNRIGVTGSSGGGIQTSMLMMCDPRIAAAAPATFIMNRQTYLEAGGAQDSEQIWQGLTALGIDHEDILLAMAPRPVLVLAARYDFFPIEGTQRSVARAQRWWKLDGDGDEREQRCDSKRNAHMYPELFIGEHTHQYSDSMARAAVAFFLRHLQGVRTEAPAATMTVSVPPDALRCTATGQVRGDLLAARTVCDDNSALLDALERRRASEPENDIRQRGLLWLSRTVNRDRTRCDLSPRFLLRNHRDGLMLESWMWWSQKGIFNHGVLVRKERLAGQALPATIAIWKDGTLALERHWTWLKQACEANGVVLVTDVTGMGPLLPHPVNGAEPSERYGALHKLTDDLLWLNDSLAAMRVFDVTRAIAFMTQINGQPGAGLDMYAHGRIGWYGLLAAALEPVVSHVESVRGLSSFAALVRDRQYDDEDVLQLIIPGLLAYFDVPDIVRWLGSRKDGRG